MDSNNTPVVTPGEQNNQVNDEILEAEAATAVEQIINTADSPNGKITTGDTSAKKGSGKGMMIAVALLALVAAGGIGFGVWAMMDGNNQTKTLNDQISSLKKQNSELMDKLNKQEEKPAVEEDVVIDTDTTTKVNPNDYIYVGEFGIKIKKPENWLNLVREYTFYNGYPHAASSFEIRESSSAGAGVYITGMGDNVTTCDDVNNNKLTCFVLNDKVFVVGELVGELAPGQDSSMSEEFRIFVTNPENYSAI